MAIDKAKLWEHYLERHRDMIMFLTVVESGTYDDMTETMMEYGPERLLGLIPSLAITLEYAIKWAAHVEGNTFTDQLHQMALQVENCSQEEMEKLMEGMGDDDG